VIIEQIALEIYNRWRSRSGMKPVSYIGANNTPECNEAREVAVAAYSAVALLQGKTGECPTCCAPGHWDFTEENKILTDAIWYNHHTKMHECHECWLK
jgi:hypothetical protein